MNFTHRFDGNTCEESVAKLTLTFNFKVKKKFFFFFVSYSTRHGGETVPRNHNNSLEKFLSYLWTRANGDFIALNAVLRNFRIRFLLTFDLSWL